MFILKHPIGQFFVTQKHKHLFSDATQTKMRYRFELNLETPSLLTYCVGWVAEVSNTDSHSAQLRLNGTLDKLGKMPYLIGMIIQRRPFH